MKTPQRYARSLQPGRKDLAAISEDTIVIFHRHGPTAIYGNPTSVYKNYTTVCKDPTGVREVPTAVCEDPRGQLLGILLDLLGGRGGPGRSEGGRSAATATAPQPANSGRRPAPGRRPK